MSIAIIDYGAGNLRSVEKALEKLGFSSAITNDPAVIKASNGVILPGVGAFDPSMLELRAKGLDSVIVEETRSGKPFLGLCLGMQLLLDTSEEGKEPGFGIIKGSVKRFDFSDTPAPSPKTRLKIPHMGWNNIKIMKYSPILQGLTDDIQVYFVHSYYCAPSDKADVLTSTGHGGEFASSISKDNIFALQFHPEKSGDVGLQILKNFGGLCK